MTNFITGASNAGEIFLNQPAKAIMGIKIYTGVIPGVACILGAVLLIWYPLRGERLREIRQKVLVLHEEKKRQFEERLIGEKKQASLERNLDRRDLEVD
jgi:Na+/melibiose symporter-like transporter